MNAINKYRFRRYNVNDPRYSFTISDSDEYNTNIYPSPHYYRTPCKANGKCSHVIDSIYPSIARCWGERYENCADLLTFTNDDTHRYNYMFRSCTYPDKRVNNYDEAKESSKSNRLFIPKKLNNKVMYDQTRLRYDLLDEIEFFGNSGTNKINTNIVLSIVLLIVIIAAITISRNLS